ncbi:MAG: hypothetical protein ACT4PZ_01425 [Panacagrimonas sp.]
MPVLITVKVKGDHTSLFAAYDRIADYEEANVPELGCHVCARTEDGMLVSGTWESREAFEQLMASALFQKILAEANLPAAPRIEIHEIYRSRH